MSTDEYVPSEGAVKLAWADRRLFLDSMGEGDPSPDAVYNAEFDRFLARVRRDAAREAEARIEAWEKQYAYDIDQANAHIDAAEARIKAAEDVLDNPIHLTDWDDPLVPAEHIRRALEG